MGTVYDICIGQELLLATMCNYVESLFIEFEQISTVMYSFQFTKCPKRFTNSLQYRVLPPARSHQRTRQKQYKHNTIHW